MNKYAFKDLNKLFQDFNSSSDGLSSKLVKSNKEKFGTNVLLDKHKKTYLQIFLSQFDNFFNYILIGSSLIVLLLGDYVDFFIITSVILINATIGFIQEGKANKIFEVLQKNIISEAVVYRDGIKEKILDQNVVVGDVLFLKDGDKIPADARLIESNNLKIDEAALTGESLTVSKDASELEDKTLGISDQKNMVFKGTHVVSGLAKALVVSVGENTQIGKVAKKIEDIQTDLPIKKSINNLSKIIILIVVLLSIFTSFFLFGYSFDTKEAFLIIVALFVSSIPESLPIILTVVLAAGFYRMSKNNVLVKKLQAVDALGQTNIVALDKTGTITKNQMKVEKIFVDNKFYYISGDGYEPKGKILCDGEAVDVYGEKGVQLILKIATTTSIGDYSFNEEEGVWESNFGDPTEVSMLVLGEKFGLKRDDLFKQYPLVNEIPFGMSYKHHSVILDIDGVNTIYTAGAPEVIIDSSSKILRDGKEINFDNSEKEKINTAINLATRDGYRVLAMSYKSNVDSGIDPNNLNKMVFVGFVAINDTIRKTVKNALEDLSSAGMRAVMITGDYVETAIGIAKKIGIWEKDSVALTGKDISSMNDVQIKSKLENTAVFARVTPEQKLKIISLYKQRGDVIAMTGDGVNDVLSLVKADLGVSMGYGATDVAKEAADIILLDNNFGSLSVGVLEGRNIYINIKKTVEYLLATNLAELFIVMFSVILGLPVALTAIQILWINLVTGAFLALGFAFEPVDKKLLKIKKWKPSKYLIDKDSLLKIINLSFIMTFVTLVVYMNYLDNGVTYSHSIVLALITIFEIYMIWIIKSDNLSIFKNNLFNNKVFIIGIFVSFGLFIFAMYNPFMQNILGIEIIRTNDWIILFSVAILIFVLDGTRKIFTKK